MFRLVFIFILFVPIVEIWGMIRVGQWIGGWETFWLLVACGVLGIYLVKKEARKAWEFARFQIERGEMPTQSMLDGVCLFIGGALLIFPGFITDIIGLMFVLPGTRPLLRTKMAKWFRRKMSQGSMIRVFWRR